MKLYTAHTKPGRAPVLVREGFSWGAFVFAPFWLLAHRAWIAGALALCAWVAVLVLVPRGLAGPVELLLAWALGLTGRDLWRWSLANDGYALVHVVAAADEDAALARLLDRRPDLIGAALAMETPA